MFCICIKYCIQYLILDGSKRVNNKQHMSKLINAQITSVEVLLQSSSFDNIIMIASKGIKIYHYEHMVFISVLAVSE